MSICILTPAPGYYEDWSVPKGHYEKLLGPDLTFRSWVDAGDLSGFGLILPLLAWGYQRDCPAWFALLERLAQLPVANPPAILRWNSNKQYLLELDAAGVPVVPTTLAEALSADDLSKARDIFGTERLVVKPPISGGADGTHLLGADEAIPQSAIGQRMMVQPYYPSIAEEGEYSLFYFGGAYSHAILKRPASGDFRVQEQFGGREQTVDANAEARALAERALVATQDMHDIAPLTYARVDMIRDPDGNLRLMELELIEPSLFLHHAADDGAAFATAVAAAAN